MAYNVLAIASPIVAATAACVVCMLLTRSTWPSLAGGWLFGFSTYEFAHLINDANIFYVGWIPLLVAVFILRFQLCISKRTFVGLAALLLLLQFGTSIEILATFTLMLGLTGVLAYAFCNGSRAGLLSLGLLVCAAYGIVALLTLPFELAILHGLPQVHPPTSTYVADLANYIVPTPVTAIGGAWAASVSERFTGNIAENAAYLGLPALAICGSWTVTHWRQGWAQVLFGVWAVAIVLSFGSYIHLLGIPITSGPWRLIGQLPLLSYALPVRFALYASFGAAIMVALWLVGIHRKGKWGPALAVLGATATVLSVWPSAGPVPSPWETSLAVPSLFTQRAYARVIAVGSTIVTLPYGVNGDSMLWQVDDSLRFRMAGGYVAGFTPLSFLRYRAVAMFYENHPEPGFVAALDRFVKMKGVDDIVIADTDMRPWAAAMLRLRWSYRRVGGAYVFSVPRGLR